MKKQQKRFLGVLFLVIALLYGCNDTKYNLPQLERGDGIVSNEIKSASIQPKMPVKLYLRTSVSGAARSFGVSSGYAPDDNTGAHKLMTLHWTQDSWDNSTNKPKLLICIYDKTDPSRYVVTDINSGDYRYEKAQSDNGFPKIYIHTTAYCLANVPADQQDVRIYLFDKKHTHTSNAKSLMIDNGQTTQVLQPLDPGGNTSPKYDFVYSLYMPLNDIVHRQDPHADPITGKVFKPVGGFLLFNMHNATDKTLPSPNHFTVHTTMFSKDFNIDLCSGLSMSSIQSISALNNSIEYDLNTDGYNEIPKNGYSYIYGIYMLPNNPNSQEGVLGNLYFRGSRTGSNVLYEGQYVKQQDFLAKINGNSVSVLITKLSPFNDTQFMVTRWEGVSDGTIKMPIYFNNNQPDDGAQNDFPVFEYQKPDGTWQRVDIEFAEFPAGKVYEMYNSDWMSYTQKFNKIVLLKGLPKTGVFKLRWHGVRAFTLQDPPAHPDKLLAVEHWGDTKYVSAFEMFYNCVNMDVEADDGPDLSGANSAQGMFRNCQNLTGTKTDFSKWNLGGQLWDMSAMFRDAYKFNGDIGKWNTSNTYAMTCMFQDARAFNQNIGTRENTTSTKDHIPYFWDVSHVWRADSLFQNAYAFNNGGADDINEWKVGNLQKAQNMFHAARSFNQNIGKWRFGPNLYWVNGMFWDAWAFNNGNDPSIKDWTMGNITYMGWMFYRAKKFNQPIGKWDVSKNTTMYLLFASASDFNQDIGSWDVSKVTTMHGMLDSASVFNNGGSNSIKNWDVRNVSDMATIFCQAPKFNQPINDWKLESITLVDSMFNRAEAFNQPLDKWGPYLKNIKNMAGMFYGAKVFNQPLNSWGPYLGNVKDMSSMFYQAKNFNQPLDKWGPYLGNVANMHGVFWSAKKFNQNIGSWNVSNVTNMSNMLDSAHLFNNGDSPDIKNWNVSKVEDMTLMFKSAYDFIQDISRWNVGEVKAGWSNAFENTNIPDSYKPHGFR